MATWYVTFDEPYTIEHHGIKGQKWGIRRFQNQDGTLTPEGQARYNKELNIRKANYEKAAVKAKYATGNRKKKLEAKAERLKGAMNLSVEDFLKREQDKRKIAVAAVASVGAVAVAALAAKGIKDLNSALNKKSDAAWNYAKEIDRTIVWGRNNSDRIQRLHDAQASAAAYDRAARNNAIAGWGLIGGAATSVGLTASAARKKLSRRGSSKRKDNER